LRAKLLHLAGLALFFHPGEQTAITCQGALKIRHEMTDVQFLKTGHCYLDHNVFLLIAWATDKRY